MNKKFIALAVSSTLIAPLSSQAQESGSSLYGRINLAISVDDSANNTTTDLADITSRFGIRGEEDLGNGLAAVYRYEFRVNSDEGSLRSAAAGPTQRLSYVGLRGGFGEFRAGSIWSTFYNTVGTYLDPTYSLGFYGYSAYVGGDYRSDNSIQYIGNFGPVGLSAQVVVDGDNPANDNIDRWSIGGSYNIGPVLLAAAYDSEEVGIDSDGDGEVDSELTADSRDRFGIAASYSGDGYTMNLGYQTLEQDDAGVDRSFWTINTGFNVGDSNRIFIQYWDGSNDGSDGSIDGDGVVLGLYHSLSSRTRLWFEGTNADLVDGSEADIYLFGLRHDF